LHSSRPASPWAIWPIDWAAPRVALVFLLIEAIGLALLGLAWTQVVALVGAAVTGFGFSLVFPAFGVEAVQRVQASNRALAMGVYTAFLDLSLGVAGPAMGWVGHVAGLPMIFLISAFAALAAVVIAIGLLTRRGRGANSTYRLTGDKFYFNYTQIPPMKIQMTVAGAVIATATLDDNASAKDFALLLPLDLSLKDYAATEKIAGLPRKLSINGAPDAYTPSAGDVSYYAPWGNLAIFYEDGHLSSGLVRLARLDFGIDAIRQTGSANVMLGRIDA
jgi:hypothetical protein